MRRNLAWTTLFWMLTAACGDDVTGGGDTEGSTGADTEGGTDGTTAGPATVTAGETTEGTGTTTTDGTTGGGSEATTSDETGASTDPTGGETTGGLLEGSIEQIGGNPNAVVISGSHAYIGIGPRLTVWDLQAQGGPGLVGRGDPLGGLVHGVAIHGTRAYVVVNQDLYGTLEVYDISDPAAPVHMGTPTYVQADYHNPTAVIVDAGVLFISDTENGIISLGLGNPDEPAPIDTFVAYGVTELAAVDGVLRYQMGGFIGNSVGTLSHTGGMMSDLGLTGISDVLDTSYVGNMAYTIGVFGFEVFDLSDPSSGVSTYYDDTTLGRSVQATSAAAYVLGETGLATYDLSGALPAGPGTLAARTERTTSSALSGTTLLGLTERGWATMFDVTAPLDPVATHELELPPGIDATGAALGDNVLGLADFYTGLRLVDPTTFESIGRFELPGPQPGAEDVDIDGGYAYLTDWSSGLYVIDIGDPTNPTQVGFIATGGYPSSVVHANGYAYVGESTGGGALRIVDVSTPSNPTLVGTLPTSKVRDVVYANGLVYLGDEEVFETGGMRIVDVSDPAAPTVLGHYTACTHVLDVEVAGELAYLACAGVDTVHVVDVSDPSQPTQDFVLDPGVSGVGSLALTTDRLWVGHAFGLLEYDNTDPAVPSFAAQYPIAWQARRITAVNETDVVASSGLAGLYRVSF